ncbi:hypothetical protein T484DRAFT_1770085 [Baffinella frigidus]|nr:hypothetical protein T484DRAFT_1770085 [Cryptophyta sp. CCMP2293]
MVVAHSTQQGDTRSAVEFLLVAKQGDTRSAVEFLLVAKDNERAMELAQAHDLMDAFALFLGADGTSQASEPSPAFTREYAKVAQFYETKQQSEQAAEFYQKAGQHQRALKLYLKAAEFYQKAGQHQRALKLYLKHQRALKLYLKHQRALKLFLKVSAWEVPSSAWEVGEKCIDKAIEVAGAARNEVGEKRIDKAIEVGEKCIDKAIEVAGAARNEVGEKCIDKAIEVAGAARNEVLSRTLVDYLTGEQDGVPKDESHIFKLYMALGNFQQAARTAVIIANHEQQHGNYKVAHKMLFDTYKDLDSQDIPVPRKREETLMLLHSLPPTCHDIPVPRELEETLMLLHSYIIVKTLVKNGDHASGARMLVRVAKSISKFPEHIVPILTSTVITCQRANLKKTSFEYASMLMRPEYRANIAESYKKKIESIVRKPSKSYKEKIESIVREPSKAEDEEPVSPCPYCAMASPTTTLDCPGCKNRVPYCIASGLRMTADDWSMCPSCRFPALHSRFSALMETDNHCPMCENEVAAGSVVHVRDPTEHLNKAARMLSESEGETNA